MIKKIFLIVILLFFWIGLAFSRREKVLEFRHSRDWFILYQILLVMQNGIKIILAILFFLCLADMPYGFYQIVRFIAFAGFLYLANLAIEDNKQKNIAVVWREKQIKYTPLFYYVLLALLFQPFFKISLGRQMWNIVDVIVGIGLIVSIFMKPQKSQT